MVHPLKIGLVDGLMIERSMIYIDNLSELTRLIIDFRKVFGSFVHDKKMPGGPGTFINGQKIDYETVLFEETIRQTVKKIGDLSYERK